MAGQRRRKAPARTPARRPAASKPRRTSSRAGDAGSHVLEIGEDGGLKIRASGGRKPRSRTVRALNVYGWRMRRIFAPLYLMLGEWLGGGILHAAHAQSAVDVIAPIALVIGILISFRYWLSSTAGRWYAGGCLAVATASLMLGARAGTLGTAIGVEVITWIVAACPWWWRNRYIYAQATAPDLNVEEQWAKFVACDGGPLPKAELVARRPVPGGWEAWVYLNPGKQSATEALERAEKVASAMRKSLESIALERHPEGDSDKLKITYLNKNPLHSLHKWVRPSLDPETGIIKIGPYATGGFAEFRPWAPVGGGHAGGAQHSLICGANGSGKSQFLTMLVLEYLRSRRCVVWIIDPQSGQSMPHVVDHVDWAALNVADGFRMLQAAERVMFARSAKMGKLRLPAFVWSAVFPMLRIIIDEAHTVFRDPVYGERAVVIVERLVQMGRKTGIGLDVVTQHPDLKQLGNSEVIRGQLQSGNIVCFRTAGRQTGHSAFQGVLTVDPSRIPKQFANGQGSAGLCYLAGPIAKEVAARTYLLEKAEERVAAAAAKAVPLDADSQAVAGDEYRARPRARGGDGSTADTLHLGPAAAPPEMPATALVPAAVTDLAPGQPDPDDVQADEGETDRWKTSGHNATTVTVKAMTEAGEPMTKGEVVAAAAKTAVELGRSKPYVPRMIGKVLTGLTGDGRARFDDESGKYWLAGGAPRELVTVAAAAPPPGPARQAAAPAPAPAPRAADLAELEPAAATPADTTPSPEEVAMAAELVVVEQWATQTTIGRKLRFGWERAGKTLDALEACGIVGEAKGDGRAPRDVLVPAGQAGAAVDAALAGTRVVIRPAEAEAAPVAAAAAAPEPVAAEPAGPPRELDAAARLRVRVAELVATLDFASPLTVVRMMELTRDEAEVVLEALHQRGVLGAGDGDQPRDVLTTDVDAAMAAAASAVPLGAG